MMTLSHFFHIYVEFKKIPIFTETETTTTTGRPNTDARSTTVRSNSATTVNLKNDHYRNGVYINSVFPCLWHFVVPFGKLFSSGTLRTMNRLLRS